MREKKCPTSFGGAPLKVVLGLAVLLALTYVFFLFSNGKLKGKATGANLNLSLLSSSTDAKKLVNFVDEAATLVATQGEKAFPEFRKQGKWWSGDNYIFVYDLSGKTLVLPPQTSLEGTYRWNTKDSNGNYYVREMITQLRSKESGWLQYAYPKPDETTATPKLAYFKKVKSGNKYYLVGSGVYLK